MPIVLHYFQSQSLVSQVFFILGWLSLEYAALFAARAPAVAPCMISWSFSCVRDTGTVVVAPADGGA